jgi:hypothetical protein
MWIQHPHSPDLAVVTFEKVRLDAVNSPVLSSSRSS